MFKHAGFSVLLLLFAARSANADLHQYAILSTEWLVDHSEAICIVEYASSDDSPCYAKAKVLQVLKGAPDKISWPLNFTDYSRYALRYSVASPISGGKVRLAFVGAENRLLDEVMLQREIPNEPASLAHYGIDQYGNYHLTQESLLKCVSKQLKSGPSVPVRLWPDIPYTRYSTQAIDLTALEWSEECYVLIFDVTESRRDHFLVELEKGDADVRLNAIAELSLMNDVKAIAAIEAATKVEQVEPTSWFHVEEGKMIEYTAETVRTSAQNTLKRIRAQQ